MVVANTYTGAPVKIGTPVLGSIISQNMGVNTEFSNVATDGDVRNKTAMIIGQTQNPTFSTHAVGELLDALGLATAFIYDLTDGAIVMYAKKKLQGGGRGGADINTSFTMGNGIAVPTSLSADHAADAVLGAAIFPISSDGIVEPVLIDNTATVPDATVGATDRYALGPIELGGVDFTEATSLNIDFGIQITQDSADGDVRPTFASDGVRRPSVTITGVDAEWFGDAMAPLIGRPTTIINTAIFLRKRANAGRFVADDTAEHIKIQLAGIVTATDGFNASGEADGTVDLQITPYHDGSNETLLIDTTSVID